MPTAPTALARPQEPAPTGLRARLERAIDGGDRPLLILALAAVALYLLELRGIVDAHGPARMLSAALDLLFLSDLALKLAVLRGRYLRSAWVATDVLSCLPALSLLAPLPWLQAVTFARLFRFLRVLRGLRVLRTLGHLPSLARMAAEQAEEGRRFRASVNAGVSAYALSFLGLMAWLHAEAERAGVDPAHLEFFLVLGALLATALFVFLIHAQVREASANQLRMLLNIALPHQVAEHFLLHPESYHDRQRAPATVLFIDFVGFSSTAEKLRDDVQGLAQHLERAMDAVVERLVAQDLIVDKFIGDAVMAFRGGPLVPGDAAEHARRVVLAAVETARALRDLGDAYFTKAKIGGASDECLIGAFGTSARLSYTALGDGVNLAARLEPASAQCGASSLFCEATRRLCGELPGIVWRRWGTVRVKGKAEPQVAWEPLDATTLQNTQFVSLYEQAREAFEKDGPAAARPLFARADAARAGGDGPSRVHLAWCDELLRDGKADKGERALGVAK